MLPCMLSGKHPNMSTRSLHITWAPHELEPGTRARTAVGAAAGNGSVTVAGESSLHKLWVS